MTSPFRGADRTRIHLWVERRLLGVLLPVSGRCLPAEEVLTVGRVRRENPGAIGQRCFTTARNVRSGGRLGHRSDYLRRSTSSAGAFIPVLLSNVLTPAASDGATEEYVSASGLLAWRDASAAEADLARTLAPRLQLMNHGRRVETLEKLFLRLANGPHRGRRVQGIGALEDLEEVLPQTSTLAAFANAENEISINLLSRLTTEVARSQGVLGYVATPPALAAAMVAMTLSASGASRIPVPTGGRTARRLDELRWYDPCCGGGVFPVAVALALLREGVRADKLPDLIFCRDIDPLSVAATRCRLAALYCSTTGVPLEKALERVSSCVALENALADVQLSFDQPHLDEPAHNCFDFCVGNPPYIRAGNLDREMKTQLQSRFPSLPSGLTDLYAYFFAHCIEMSARHAVITLVTPASYQRSASGAPLRKLIEASASVDAVLDLNENAVFEAVSQHTVVTSLTVGKEQGKIRIHSLDTLDQPPALEHWEITPSLSPSKDNYASSKWYFANGTSHELVRNAVSASALSVSEYYGPTLSGIKSGLSQAYVVEARHAAELRADLGPAILWPLLRPVDLARWEARWRGHYHIVITDNDVIQADSPVYRHLAAYRNRLAKRVDTQNKQHWYSLRSCSYLSKFAERKIVFPDIAANCRFSLDVTGAILTDGAFFIPADAEDLIALLNSRLALEVFRSRCHSIGNPHQGGRLRFKKSAVDTFPLPDSWDTRVAERKEMSRAASDLRQTASLEDEAEKRVATLQLEATIDDVVYDLYEVPASLREP